MRLRIGQCIAILAVFSLGVPVWAAARSTQVFVSGRPAYIYKTQLKPGEYKLVVPKTGDQMKVADQYGKVIAQVPFRWVSLGHKASNTEVIFTKRNITEIQFGGQPRAAKIG